MVLEIPVDANPNIYNSFITPEQQKEIEAGIAAGDTAVIARVTNQINTAEAAAISSRLEDCRKNIAVEDMPQAIIWFDELAKQAQGRA
jgi:hypothetical protein